MPRNAGTHPDRYFVALANEQTTHTVNEDQLTAAVIAVLGDSSFTSADISLAVVDDPAMHRLNRQFLEHDYPTDVLSFVLEDMDSRLEGEVIISADTAATEAAEHGWSTAAEMLLYVVHGTLHLVGYRDKSPDEMAEMRAAEAKYLAQFGFNPNGSIASIGRDGGAPVTNAGNRRTGR
jgi:probable rRNA maturation factor